MAEAGVNVKHLCLALHTMLYLPMVLTISVYNWLTDTVDTDFTRNALILTLAYIQGHTKLRKFLSYTWIICYMIQFTILKFKYVCISLR